MITAAKFACVLLLFSSAAYAQASGETSGSSNGTVKPSSAIPASEGASDKSGQITGSSQQEKTPGVQGPAGSKNGPSAKGQ